MRLVFEQDWLGTQPYFYNLETGKHGPKFHDAVDSANFSFDNSGLDTYFRFGYSVFGSTPVKNVKFLEANSQLWVDETGSLILKRLPDPLDHWSHSPTTVDDVIDRLRSSVGHWASKQQGQVILPLSGGLDSRLLLWAFPVKSQVHAYTYGISKNPSDSTEVIYASEIAQRMHIKWNHVNLAGFHDYINQWDSFYGLSMHSHGMYQMKFYHEISKIEGEENLPLLSGILGDVWAGSIPFMQIFSSEDIARLGFTHGVQAESTSLLTQNSGPALMEEYFRQNKDKIDNPQQQVVSIARLKIMLLSYLFSTPVQFGFLPWSPFLDLETVRAMLFLPQKLRNNRSWQRDFLAREGLGIDRKARRRETFNSLDFDEQARNPLPLLDAQLLGEYVNKDYINWINERSRISLAQNICHLPMTRSLSRRISFPRKWSEWSSAYNALLVIYPMQRALRLRY